MDSPIRGLFGGLHEGVWRIKGQTCGGKPFLKISDDTATRVRVLWRPSDGGRGGWRRPAASVGRCARPESAADRGWWRTRTGAVAGSVPSGRLYGAVGIGDGSRDSERPQSLRRASGGAPPDRHRHAVAVPCPLGGARPAPACFSAVPSPRRHGGGVRPASVSAAGPGGGAASPRSCSPRQRRAWADVTMNVKARLGDDGTV